MSVVTHAAPVSSMRLRAGKIVSALPALLLLFSGTMKLLKMPTVIEGMAHYGYPEHLPNRLPVNRIPGRRSVTSLASSTWPTISRVRV